MTNIEEARLTGEGLLLPEGKEWYDLIQSCEGTLIDDLKEVGFCPSPITSSFLWMERVIEHIIAKAKPSIETQAIERVFEGIDAQINELIKYRNGLELQRQPLIEAMDTRQWTPEEDQFMHSSVHEIVEIPHRIDLLNNLREALKARLEVK